MIIIVFSFVMVFAVRGVAFLDVETCLVHFRIRDVEIHSKFIENLNDFTLCMARNLVMIRNSCEISK